MFAVLYSSNALQCKYFNTRSHNPVLGINIVQDYIDKCSNLQKIHSYLVSSVGQITQYKCVCVCVGLSFSLMLGRLDLENEGVRTSPFIWPHFSAESSRVATVCSFCHAHKPYTWRTHLSSLGEAYLGKSCFFNPLSTISVTTLFNHVTSPMQKAWDTFENKTNTQCLIEA